MTLSPEEIEAVERATKWNGDSNWGVKLKDGTVLT